MKAAIAANAKLQERNALKSVGLAAAMTAALVARGVPDATAHLAGELGSSRSGADMPSGPRASATTTISPGSPSRP